MQSDEETNMNGPFDDEGVAHESSQAIEEESMPLLTRSACEGGEGGDKGEEKGEEEGAAEGEKKEEEEELDAGAKVGKMPGGDFTIHILVQGAR